MKYQMHTVDARIKHFLKRKLAEFPELEEINVMRIEAMRSVRFLDDVASIFQAKKGRV